MTHRSAIVIGAGIGGLCAAIALRKIGYRLKVYESGKEVRAAGAGLGIGTNALAAFRILGVDDAVLKASNPLRKISMKSAEGRVLMSMDAAGRGDAGQMMQLAVHRAALLDILRAELGTDCVLTGKACRAVRQDEHSAVAEFTDGTERAADLIVAADGIHSVIRRSLLPASAARYAGYTCWRAVVRPSPELMPEEGHFVETLGSKGRFGVVPLPDRSVYWFACINAAERDPALAAWGIAELGSRFSGYGGAIPGLIAQTDDSQLLHNDIADIKPLRPFAFGRIALLGDAAHAMTPNMGQGACQAIEDAVVLAGCLQMTVCSGQSVPQALKRYESLRVGRTGEMIRKSRLIGEAAQWESRPLIAARNILMRLVPEAVRRKELERLHLVKFEPLYSV